MIDIVVGLVTDLKVDGHKRWLYLLTKVPFVPMPGPFTLLLPSPQNCVCEPMHARIEYVTIAGSVVHVRATADNVIIDEEVFQGLLEIGYSEQLPDEYVCEVDALVIPIRPGDQALLVSRELLGLHLTAKSKAKG